MTNETPKLPSAPSEMQSLLRQIVAGPRARHPEANLDLCYVTDNIIATSGPSASYPSLAYRTPLSELVAFLDSRHGEDWCIWEFRAEGTGYPDSEVHDRIWHFPWPDHHPPPFALVPKIMASMRNWLTEDGKATGKKRVVVVHCKAGKGRSGSMAISYLMTHEGWKREDAMQRFSERRMRPGFGAGISIPSQKRWLEYVERWSTKGGRMYIERAVEVIEVHVWGLREGVKMAVEGYVEDGRKIKTFHVFHEEERDDTDSRFDSLDSPDPRPQRQGTAFASVVQEATTKQKLKLMTRKIRSGSRSPNSATSPSTPSDALNTSASSPATPSSASLDLPKPNGSLKPSPLQASASDTASATSSTSSTSASLANEPRVNTVFRPSHPIVIPTSDINFAVEQRKGWANTVTSVAHVWFNCYFEGNGPERWQEKHGSRSSDDLIRTTTGPNESSTIGPPMPDDSGVFTIEWEAMDGIKGGSRKGTKAFDKVAVVWKAVAEADSGQDLQTPTAGTADAQEISAETIAAATEGDVNDLKMVPSIVIPEPEPGDTISPAQPADWRGSNPHLSEVIGEPKTEPQIGPEGTKQETDAEDGVEGLRRGIGEVKLEEEHGAKTHV